MIQIERANELSSDRKETAYVLKKVKKILNVKKKFQWSYLT